MRRDIHNRLGKSAWLISSPPREFGCIKPRPISHQYPGKRRLGLLSALRKGPLFIPDHRPKVPPRRKPRSWACESWRPENELSSHIGCGGPQGVPHLRQEGPKSASIRLGLKPVPRQEGENHDVGRKLRVIISGGS